jgi:hypothetical protein
MTDSLKRPLGDLVLWFCESARVDQDEFTGRPPVTSMALDLPVELAVEHAADGSVRVLASPPTQRVATTFLPVFHRFAVRIEREEPPGDGR